MRNEAEREKTRSMIKRMRIEGKRGGKESVRERGENFFFNLRA